MKRKLTLLGRMLFTLALAIAGVVSAIQSLQCSRVPVKRRREPAPAASPARSFTIPPHITVSSAAGRRPHARSPIPYAAAKRLGTPDDVARAALYLAADDAAWITGIILDVAGGAVMG
jgi:NAD(P)-dependent dehydrogenase (short-subunit alcohol dehydrogenase family)